VVEVDETYIGGLEPCLNGGRAEGKKVLTGVAVEIREPKGIGRCRIRPLVDASAASLHPFVKDYVEPGTRVITDGWQGYRGLERLGFIHDRRSQRAARARGEDSSKLLPAVHRVASLAKRWLLGTHQGSVDDAHLTSYLNEFVFRFNRRRSRSRGMVFYRVLELAVDHALCATEISSSPSSPEKYHPRHPAHAGIRRAWSARQRIVAGGTSPVKWIPPSDLMPDCSADRVSGRSRFSRKVAFGV
jgi:transposase-like protein